MVSETELDIIHGFINSGHLNLTPILGSAL